ncbi:MAG: rhodanese-like domain-containing protein [Acidobacteria bacterium]|nr:rhodanese-like domain-containing protein [Acidobacteriota bacterium]MDA1233935.1 rhodanese-like domain-containing protein [Acidobacteriota bacterium]
MTRTILAMILAIGCWACSATEPAVETAAAVEPAVPAAVEMDVESVAARLDAGEDIYLLDVRNPDELEEHGMIAGAINIPIDQLQARLSEVPKDKEIVTYCMRGGRASTAADILREAGYTEPIEYGGITAWKEAGKPVVQPGQ